MSGSVPILFQPTEIAAFAFLRRACSPFSPGWGGEPLHPAQLELFGSRRRRVVDVEFARPRPGDVVSFDFYDLDGAALPAGEVDDDGVSGSHRTVGLSSVSVDLDPAALTRGLGLRAALEETRHVEPDVESNRCVLRHWVQCRSCSCRRQPDPVTRTAGPSRLDRRSSTRTPGPSCVADRRCCAGRSRSGV